ncbi:hypothetical protein FBZ84_101595 [Azospirillum baldaniorum]|nr:hypothetical protein FBZ84_101595 [Azospirillum baldaniorum]
MTGPLNATSTQAFETVRLLLLDRDAQATRDASPTPEPVRGQRSKPPPAHPFSQHGINDIQDPAAPQENRNTPRPFPSRSGPPGPECLLFSRPVGASLAATASGGALYAGCLGSGKHFFRPTAIFPQSTPDAHDTLFIGRSMLRPA